MSDALKGVVERFRNQLVEKREDDIRQIDARAEALLSDQTTDEGHPLCGGWGDVEKAEDEGISSGGSSFGRLYALAQVWGTPGSRYEGDAEVARRLNLAWRFYHKLVYVDCPFPNNWWAWQVGIPRSLGDTMLIAGDALGKAERRDAVATLKYLADHIRTEMTGANGMWGAMNYLRYGLITGDTDYVDRASKWAARECEIRPVNGILSDYSYSFHGSAVHMGYGRSHFADVGRYVYMMGDSPWQLDEAALSNYVNWLLEFVRWTVVGDGIDPFIIGREVSRGERALKATQIIDGALMAASAPIPRRDEVLAFCAQAMQEGLTPSNPVAVELTETLSPEPSGPLYGARYWPVIEYFSARRPRFAASVKMSSTRTKSWFSIRGENLKAWHTSDGHLILRMQGDAFMNDVIPTMDWDRLTGITRSDGFKMPRETEGQSPFVCGAADGDGHVGCCGVDFTIRNEDGTALRARKSWFFLDDAIVTLGSDVACDGPAEVETVIRQAALPRDAAPETAGRQEETVRIAADGDCAYVFLDAVSVRRYTEERKGHWGDITQRGRSDELARYYSFTVIPHGVRPDGAGYAAAYLPGQDADAASAWLQEGRVTVVQRDSSAHIVRDMTSGMTMAVRWGVGAEVNP